MGRVISGTMGTILSSSKREIDYTLDLVFSDEEMHFATSPLTSVNGHNYTNDIEGVGEIRQTLEAPTDNVNLKLQNKDLVLGRHVAASRQKWQTATAVVGRYYYQIGADGKRTGTNQWIEMFRGSVQQPVVDDAPDEKNVQLSIIPDVRSGGSIICTTTLSPLCPNIFKDDNCGYTGVLTTCNKRLKSPDGCDGRNNSHRFRGMEHRYNPDVSIPGTGGNSGGGGNGGGCPHLDQFIRVRGESGEIVVIRVAALTEDDWLWDSIERQFFKVRTARVIRDVPIWQIKTFNGAASHSSFSHHVMPGEEHPTGLVAETIERFEAVLTETSERLIHSYAVTSEPTGERGDVMFIEMDGGHHYAAGDTEDDMVVAHNRKGDPFEILP